MALFPVTLSDPRLPQTNLLSTFCIACHIYVVDEDRDLKFGI